MVLAPKRYTSEWAVILPGAGAETRVDLDRIGQAQSSASSPFSDKALSPKVNYQEIVQSRPVLTAAAKAVGLTFEEFGKPRIKLVDQASIILFEVTARSPQDAQKRSWALFDALRTRLDELRLDEMRTKNAVLRNSISEVEVGLKTARQRLLELQTETGLASIEQYNQLVTSIETMRREQANARATLAEKRSEFAAIRKELGIESKTAATLLTISADPELRKLSSSYADAKALHAEMATRFGTQHPRAVDAASKAASISAVLADALKGHGADVSEAFPSLPLDSERAVALLTEFLQKDAERAGLEARLAEIDLIMADLEDRRVKLGAVAARLDDLQRDHAIANAVFSSALARLDASKSDHYASYPLAQMLSEPTLPDAPSSPRLLFAAIGAVGGSGLAVLGWLFAWMHQMFLFERLGRLRRGGGPAPGGAPAFA
jgi:uncharacterized protein involved in exopolysaccharide biosynthesis